MTSRRRSEAGPYERTIVQLLAKADQSWWTVGEPTLAFGGPPWLAVRLAAETGSALRPCSGGNCMTTLADLSVLGCPTLDGPPAGRLVLQDLMTGRSQDLGIRCHPDLPPHRWVHLTLALAEGINPNAALDLAAIAIA